MGPVEVVEVEFDPRTLPYEKLLAHAADRECAIRVFARTDEQMVIAERKVGRRAARADGKIRLVDDQKYYLGRTALRHVPMTATQATRINADMKHARDYLSPRQLVILDAATERPDDDWPTAVDQDPTVAWPTAWSLASGS